jgi:GTPase SAR1 family protein
MPAVIGKTTDNQLLSIGDIERRSGLYVLGKPGMGKTSLIIRLINQDIENNHGVFFIDPHGEAIDDLLKSQEWWFLPSKRVAIINPETEQYTFGINLLKCENIESLNARTDTYTRAYSIFNKIWAENWGVWLQLIIQNTLYALIESQEYTLAEVPLFLTDKPFRDHVISRMRYQL